MKTRMTIIRLSHFAIARDDDGNEYHVAPYIVRSTTRLYHGATILATVAPANKPGALPQATEVELCTP